MQTPKARNGSLSRLPKNPNPRVTDRKSPPSPASEKKRSTKPSELESQLTHLQEELKKAKEQLNFSESSKKQAHQEAELAKRQLATTSEKLEDSKKQLFELSASEDDRILELRKLANDRDRAWESELEALQKQHISDSSALAFANNEINKLKNELKEALHVIDKLKSEDNKISEKNKNNEDLEKVKVELDCARIEVRRLKNALELADKRYQEEYIQSTFQIRSAYELFEKTKSESSELESKLKRANERIKALEANNIKIENIEKNQENKREMITEIDTEKEKIEALKACLMEKEKETRRMAEENEVLKREKEMGRESNEMELRRLKIQSDQWRKAAEVATAMLSNEKDDNNYHTIGGKLGLPFYEDVEEDLAKKKNATVLKKIGVLLKKGQK